MHRDPGLKTSVEVESIDIACGWPPARLKLDYKDRYQGDHESKQSVVGKRRLYPNRRSNAPIWRSTRQVPRDNAAAACFGFRLRRWHYGRSPRPFGVRG